MNCPWRTSPRPSERAIKMEENTIYVEVEENSQATLTFPKYNIKTKAYIGENGAST